VDTQLIAADAVLVTVEFGSADGRIFQHHGRTTFGFTVKLIDSFWRVIDLPVYLA